jgi:antitoxin VapB
MNGRSQAVRLPAEYRFEGKEVYITKEGDKVILSPKPTSWDDFFDSPIEATPDFMAERINRGQTTFFVLFSLMEHLCILEDYLPFYKDTARRG